MDYFHTNFEAYKEDTNDALLPRDFLKDFGYLIGNHLDEIVKLNCIDIKTKHQMYVMQGIKTLGKMTVVVALCTTLAVIFFLCVMTVLMKRYCRRKAYKEPDGNGMVTTNASNYKVGTMSQIPLDNLYNPPSTPICTSRTSLITASNA